MIDYLLAVFAVYRLARLFTMEEGPLSIFERIRETIDPYGEQKSSLARGINCPLCVGVWASAVVTMLLPRDKRTPITWLGLAGAQTLLHLAVEK